MFQRTLAKLKERFAAAPLPGCPERLEWRPYRPREPDPTIVCAFVAYPLYFRLSVVEYEAHHADELQTFPICYELVRTPFLGAQYSIESGPAPTIEEAKRRVEEAWLACLGAKASLPPVNPANDPKGVNFKRMVQHVRARARHRKPKPARFVGLAWVSEGPVEGTIEVRSALADYVANGHSYNLFVVELDDAAVREKASGDPSITWTIRTTDEDGMMSEVVAEAPAPSFEQAMQQCEEVFRIEIGAIGEAQGEGQA